MTIRVGSHVKQVVASLANRQILAACDSEILLTRLQSLLTPHDVILPGTTPGKQCITNNCEYRGGIEPRPLIAWCPGPKALNPAKGVSQRRLY